MAWFLLPLLAALPSASAQSPEDSVIRSGVPWVDTSGNRIYAGGANMYEEGGVYYLIGEGEKLLSDCSKCFNLYKSTDLVTWDFVSCALKNEDIVAPQKPSYYRMERPKIFKCPGTQKYTMWFHCDTPDFSMRSVGVLTADAVTGPYTFTAPCFRPDGEDSYDMGTFVDDAARGGDGRAYLIRSVRNQFAGISQMTEDCLNVTGIVSSGPDMEGQALMRDTNGTLHAAGSHLTGWAPNPAQFVTSPNASLVGALWADNVNPSGDPTTYGSQSTFIFPFVHADGHTTFIWMADRWNMGPDHLPGGLANMTNVWLPLIYSGGAPPSYMGSPLLEATCDEGDANQAWAWPAGAGGGVVLHVASGLCVLATGSSGALTLGDCGSATTWAVTEQGTIEDGAGGGSCLGWNAVCVLGGMGACACPPRHAPRARVAQKKNLPAAHPPHAQR